jgi:hypothetical protein
MFIAQDGSARGQFHAVRLGISPLGTAQNITVEREVSSGVALPAATLSTGSIAVK